MFTKPFSKLSKKDADIAGGKGASLGEMLQSNIPVPDGYVVLSTTFDEFLHKSDLAQEIDAILESVDHRTISSVESVSEKIQELINHAEMPEDIKEEIESQFFSLNSEFVAVRSSATAEDGADHAWAGQLESYLNITQDTLLEKVQHCWASLFTPRAIFYRFEKGLDTTKISVAVVVQKMVNSEKSGIAFSVHPVTEDRNQIIIEAGFGLGEAIVSGSVTPDSYVISKQPREIIDINVSNQTRAMYRKVGGGNEWLDISEKGGTRVLNDSEILALSEIIMTIENHYGFPCDIEWAYEGGKFYIVQSRPITTLSNDDIKENNKIKSLYTKQFARDFSLPLIQVWTGGESTDQRQWTEKQQPFLPYIIFERTHKTVNCYMDERGIEWIKQELGQHIKNDSNYIKKILGNLEAKLDKLQPIYDNPRVLLHDELVQYLIDLRNMWAPFEALWWIMELLNGKNHQDFVSVQKVRERMNYMSVGSDKVIRDSLKQIYPEIGNLSSVLLFEEIQKNSIPDVKILEKRYDSYFYTQDEIFIGATRKNIEDKFDISFEKNNIVASGSIKGQIAQKGIIRGKVRILMGSIDNELVQDGEVIVSSMTMPDMMPALKKAVAFVTDEGGITCHAAIVARELNKPCVIGTKFATEILKDGDEVEVDADNGVVRIISHNDKSVISNKKVEEHSISISDWYQLLDKDHTKILEEDIYKRERLEIAHKHIGLPIDKCYKFNSIPEQEGIDVEYDQFFNSYKNTKCLVKLIPKSPELPKFRNYGILELVINEWYKKQPIQNINDYRVECFTMVEEGNGNYSIIFNVSEKGIFGVYTEGLRTIIVQDKKDTDELVNFSSDFKDYTYNTADTQIIERINKAVSYVKVSKEKQKSLQDVIDCTFHQDYLEGYFELISNNLKGDYFIDWNRFLLQDADFSSKKEHKQEGQISGYSLSKGNFSGSVKLYSQATKNTYSKSDILVCDFLDIDMIQDLQSCGAILIEKGNILSHMAIVAREFKKPCVIGVKFATEILKDGDEVEVDADNGVVRILSSKSYEFKELVHLNVPLSLVELHYEQESNEQIPWAEENFIITPYIAYNKVEDQIYFYYDPNGITWQKNHAGIFKDKASAISKIKEGFDKIKVIINEEKVLDKIDFITFIQDIRSLWPWINYMWWAIEYAEENGKDFSELLEMRKYTEYFTPGLIAVLQKSIKNILPEFSEYADCILLSEIETDAILDVEILKKRKKSFAYTKGKLYNSWEDLQKDFNIKIKESQQENTNILQGQIAFKGVVTGKVKIILKREQLIDFKVGNILVSSTTTPDYLPAMKIAGAIISEHGGMICHAAITSRELKIPCIVGVSGATQILKDGDLVEVDANKGIVTKIS